MKIGILQTGKLAPVLAEAYGEYPEMFMSLLAGQGFTFENWAVVDGEFPDDVNDADGWLVTGSRHGSYEDLPFIAPLEDFLRKTYAAGVPIVGICFGHQILAQALGGKVAKFEGGWSVGPTKYDLEGYPDGVTLNAWHQDQVIEIPEDARVIGSTPFCKYAMLAYGDKALSIQPHPEIMPDYLEGLLEVRAPGVVPDPLIKDARDKIDTPLSDGVIAQQMSDFFKQKQVTHE